MGIMELAEGVLKPVFAAQNLAIDGQIAEA